MTQELNWRYAQRGKGGQKGTRKHDLEGVEIDPHTGPGPCGYKRRTK